MGEFYAGIDLGTTNSVAAVFDTGRPIIVPNALGESMTRSVVAVGQDGYLLVGTPGEDRWLTQPTQGAASFKLKMGTRKEIPLGDLRLTAEELSSRVLGALWGDLQHWAAQREAHVVGVVVSVPAYFGNAQRAATRRACALAGLPLLRLISEPTAAALAYGLQAAPRSSTIVVLDWGGGTFDVSILQVHDGMFQVRSAAGDNHLGGEDVNEVLIAWFASHHRDLPSREQDEALRVRLWREAERVKRALGSVDEVEFALEWNGQRRALTINQTEFTRLLQPLLLRLRAPIQRAWRDARLKHSDVHQVVLAGGATRLRAFQRLVTDMFRKFPAMNIDPDLVVGQGAAVMAAMLGNHELLQEVLLIDNCPYSLGIETARTQHDGSPRAGYSAVIIERNTPLPASREETFHTTVDQQTQVGVEVYQGEARMAADNTYLGRLEVPVPPKPAGEATIQVRFTYDASGILEVLVRQQELQSTHQLVLQSAEDALPEAEVAERLAALAALKTHPRDQQVNQALKARAERLYEELRGPQRERLGVAIDDFDQALAEQAPEIIEVQRKHLAAMVAALQAP